MVRNVVQKQMLEVMPKVEDRNIDHIEGPAK